MNSYRIPGNKPARAGISSYQWPARGVPAATYGHGIAQYTMKKVRIMKKLGFLTLALSLSVYSLGCGSSTTAPAAPAAPAAGATDTAAAPAHGEADHEHAEGDEAHADGAHADEAAK